MRRVGLFWIIIRDVLGLCFSFRLSFSVSIFTQVSFRRAPDGLRERRDAGMDGRMDDGMVLVVILITPDSVIFGVDCVLYCIISSNSMTFCNNI